MAEHSIVSGLAKLQYDLTAIKARVSELQRQVAALGLMSGDEPSHVCPVSACQLRVKSERRLAEHLRNVHDCDVELAPLELAS